MGRALPEEHHNDVTLKDKRLAGEQIPKKALGSKVHGGLPPVNVPDVVVPSSNQYAMDPGATEAGQPEEPPELPITEEDERHMREDLHRDPDELAARNQRAFETLQQHQKALQEAAPGDRLEDMAAGDTTPHPAGPFSEEEFAIPVDDRMHEVHLRNLKSEPTSKATRGYT